MTWLEAIAVGRVCAALVDIEQLKYLAGGHRHEGLKSVRNYPQCFEEIGNNLCHLIQSCRVFGKVERRTGGNIFVACVQRCPDVVQCSLEVEIFGDAIDNRRGKPFYSRPVDSFVCTV